MANKASMSAFHGLFNIAGIAGQLARGERELGFCAKSICFPSGVGQSDVDELINGPLVQVDLLQRCLDEFDVFNFHFGYTFLGQSLRDLSLLRRRGKRIVMHFHGCDIRESKSVMKKQAYSACAECWPFGCNANRALARREAENLADVVAVTTPDLLEFLPGAIWLPQAVDSEAILRLAETLRSSCSGEDQQGASVGRPVRIVHAPSSTKLKGSYHLVRAVDELRAEGHDIELTLLHNMSHSKVLEQMFRADIVVDQLLIGAYGVAAIEAMILGKPTICYVRDDVAESYGRECPIVRAAPHDIKQRIVELIERRADWNDIGRRSQDFALGLHARQAVASRIRSHYRGVADRSDV